MEVSRIKFWLEWGGRRRCHVEIDSLSVGMKLIGQMLTLFRVEAIIPEVNLMSTEVIGREGRRRCGSDIAVGGDLPRLEQFAESVGFGKGGDV